MLKPDPQNARTHTRRNKQMIRDSLAELGAFRSIAVDGDDVIRAGNGVYEQAQELGLKVRIVEAGPDELIAVKRADLTGERAERAALFDNRTAELSEWDADILALLQTQTPEVLTGVFDGGELAAVIEEGQDLAEVKAQIESADGEEKVELSKGLGDTKAKIRPVLYAGQLAVFEQAIRATDIENRGDAIIAICRFYLENKHGKPTAERQLDL